MERRPCRGCNNPLDEQDARLGYYCSECYASAAREARNRRVTTIDSAALAAATPEEREVVARLMACNFWNGLL